MAFLSCLQIHLLLSQSVLLNYMYILIPSTVLFQLNVYYRDSFLPSKNQLSDQNLTGGKL